MLQEPVRIVRDGEIAFAIIDHPPVNALSQKVRQGLWDAVETLDADPAVRAVILLCDGRTFIAGADVSEFGKPPEKPYLPDLIARIEKAAKPWIAAIHGTALGGGFEVALACRYRIAMKTASVGLPEVRLGLVPGAGGTVRLPRLTDIETAVEMVTTGMPVGAEKALAKGLIDEMVTGDLRETALAFARKSLAQPPPESLSARGIAASEASFWQSAEKAVAGRAKGEAAPLQALACLKRATEADFADAMDFERQTFLTLRASPEAAALRHVFFAERAAPRPPELSGIKPRPIGTVGVVGGGTMGAGIAASLRDAGLPVMLVERDGATLAKGLGNLKGIFDSAVKRGRLSADEMAERMAGVTGTTDYSALHSADLVIEAVFEDIAVKRQVFQNLASVCRSDTILATNTSYLDPRRIVADLPNAERYIGLHFFSPAQVMKLLEIVPLDQTAPDVLASGFALAQKLGKIPVRAGICDGFIGNRILKVTRAQAERALLSGASPHDVDRALTRFGLPMGPFAAQDLGGLDIADLQRKAARERGETPFAPIAERLCASGRLGQKTQGGWYDYRPADRTPHPSQEVARIIAEEAKGSPKRTWNDETLADAIILPMINEAMKILGEGIALRSADIDLVEIHGYGFPRRLGGLLHYAEARGLMAIVSSLRGLAEADLAAPPCDELLQEMTRRAGGTHAEPESAGA